MRILPSNTYLIEILKPIAYMKVENYIQFASKGPGERFYVDRGCGGVSISAKNVLVLGQCVSYWPDTNEERKQIEKAQSSYDQRKEIKEIRKQYELLQAE